VIVTNGATEAIYLIAQAFAQASSLILQPTFTEYEDACKQYQKPPSPPRGSLLYTTDPSKWDTLLKELLLSKELPLGGLGGFLFWLCNPNNPTGQVIPKPILESAIASHPDTIFIIDESYAPFTMQPLVSTSMSGAQNVLLLHSMTKEFAIPGLRLGYITGSAALLSLIRKCRMPWSVNQLAIEAAHYLLAHKSDYALDLPALMAERKRMSRELSAIDGITVYPSNTHILLCRIEGTTAAQLKDYLANNYGILIRDASNFRGLDEHYFRIAVQTPEEDNQLLNKLKEWRL
jgi:threonine-phosphate decarboxylase